MNNNNTINIIKLRHEHPKWTLKQIADACSVTKQRVHYVLKRECLPTKIFNKILEKNKYKNCHFCKSLMIRGTGSNYCNSICRDNHLYINYPCSFCRKNMKLNRNIMLKKIHNLNQYNFFCGRKCYGKFKEKVV